MTDPYWLRCENCFFCQISTYGPSLCRRYPPTNEQNFRMPKVNPTDWCGEFINKEHGNDALVAALRSNKGIPLHRKLRE